MRWLTVTEPVPLQSGQISGVVPGAQPVPLQSVQVSTFATVTSFLQPKAASSKLMFTVARTLSPRRGALGLERVEPPKPPKISLKMSPKPPKPPKPSKPPAPKPALGSKAA